MAGSIRRPEDGTGSWARIRFVGLAQFSTSVVDQAPTLARSAEYPSIWVSTSTSAISHTPESATAESSDVADVTSDIPSSSKFDLILMNSLMHHLDDAGVAHLLGSLPTLLADDGEIHILDLVLAERGLPRNSLSPTRASSHDPFRSGGAS